MSSHPDAAVNAVAAMIDQRAHFVRCMSRCLRLEGARRGESRRAVNPSDGTPRADTSARLESAIGLIGRWRIARLPPEVAAALVNAKRSVHNAIMVRSPLRASGILHRLGLLGVLCMLTCAACSRSAADSGESTTAPVALASEHDSPRTRMAARARAMGGAIIESASDGRVLAGTARSAPDNATVPLVYDAFLLDDQGRRYDLPCDGVQDARFLPAPSRRIALLEAQGRLVLWDPRSGRVEPVDDDVFPGFAFSHDAKLIAYAQGFGPSLRGWLVDLDRGKRIQLGGSPPVWGFAFSPDDTRIAFVDSPDSFPALATMAVDGGDVRPWPLPSYRRSDRLSAPYPDQRRPPLWTRAGLFIEASGGVSLVGEDGNIVEQWAGASELHEGASGSLVLFDGTTYRRVP